MVAKPGGAGSNTAGDPALLVLVGADCGGADWGGADWGGAAVGTDSDAPPEPLLLPPQAESRTTSTGMQLRHRRMSVISVMGVGFQIQLALIGDAGVTSASLY